jgi:hypothetical protein
MRNKSRALTMDQVRARFEEWRQNRQARSPIPDALWSAVGRRCLGWDSVHHTLTNGAFAQQRFPSTSLRADPR